MYDDLMSNIDTRFPQALEGPSNVLPKHLRLLRGSRRTYKLDMSVSSRGSKTDPIHPEPLRILVWPKSR